MSLNSERRRLDTHIARTDRAISRTLLSVSTPELDSEDPHQVEEETERFIARLRSAIRATVPRVNQGVASAAEIGSEAAIRLASEQLRR